MHHGYCTFAMHHGYARSLKFTNFYFYALFFFFRSGIETLPHNAKAHYNFANFLKDTGRAKEAIYHYETALK